MTASERETPGKEKMIVFTNAQVFDGLNNRLTAASVVVDGERIQSVSDARRERA